MTEATERELDEWKGTAIAHEYLIEVLLMVLRQTDVGVPVDVLLGATTNPFARYTKRVPQLLEKPAVARGFLETIQGFRDRLGNGTTLLQDAPCGPVWILTIAGSPSPAEVRNLTSTS